MTTFLLSPGAKLDFAFDWATWLAASESITGHTVTVTDGVTKDTVTRDGAVITVWLRDGVLGSKATVTCHVTTNSGREDARSFDVSVVNR